MLLYQGWYVLEYKGAMALVRLVISSMGERGWQLIRAHLGTELKALWIEQVQE